MRAKFLSERVWPVVRALALQILLMSGVVGGLVAVLAFSVLVNRLDGLQIDLYGDTAGTIAPEWVVWGSSIAFCVNLILVVLAWRFLERKRLGDMLWGFSRGLWKPLMWGLLAGMGEIALTFGGLAACGAVRVSWGLAPVPTRTAALALGWVFTSSISGPVLEEALNRGYMFQNVRRGWGVVAATISSALLFAAFHMLNPNPELLGAVNITLVAVLWVMGMLWFRSMWFPIGWHAVWNFAEFFVLGLPNSGISVGRLGLEGTTLLATEVSGPRWLTGRDFGMEASLVNTVVLVIAIATMLWLGQRRGCFRVNASTWL